MTPEQKSAYHKDWYSRNKEAALAKAKIYRELNREKINERQRENDARGYGKAYYAKNREKCRQYGLEWRRKNKEKSNSYLKKYKEANRAKIAARDSLWKRVHRKRVSAYEKKRLCEDLNLRIKKRLRLRVLKSVQRQAGKKAKRTMELLGCSIPSFRIYIESKFQPGMTWENCGSVWHLDHIVPCALFDLTKPEHQMICFHFSNYQPLFAPDNIRKGAKFQNPVQIGLPLPEQ